MEKALSIRSSISGIGVREAAAEEDGDGAVSIFWGVHIETRYGELQTCVGEGGYMCRCGENYCSLA